MITAIVQFKLPQTLTVAEAKQRFDTSAPKYKDLPGLVRKYYLLSEDGQTGGGVYLWESREAAERVYNGEWRERIEKLYGAKPTISWFASPTIVNNAAQVEANVTPRRAAGAR
jgi:hypothetical protein